MAMPANAQVESMADLYGTYKFTATITPTDAGKEYQDVWQDECEVIITKDTEFGAPAIIKGLMGADYEQLVSAINVEENNFYVNNPNPQYGLWSGYIGVTEESADDPQMYTMYYNYDPETKEITIPDFQIAGFSWPGGVMTATVYANVTNVKLELMESETIEVADIAGEWSYKPYSLGYVRNDSTFVYEFKMNLEAKDDTNKEYSATFSFEGFDEFTLDATFNGVDLVIPFDSLYLDAEQKIRFGIGATSANPENVFVKSGQFSFSYSSSTLMWQGDYIYIRQEGTTTEEVDGVMVEKEVAPIIQSMTYGWIEREDPNAYDWSGVYTLSVSEDGYLDYDEEDGISFPETFNVTIEAGAAGAFNITEFLGCKYMENNNYNVYYSINKKDDGTYAIDFSSYYGPALLQSLGAVGDDYAYYVITDGMGEPGEVLISVDEEGNVVLGDFMVMYWTYYANEYVPIVKYAGGKMTKYEAPAFDWAGTYTATATVVEQGGTNNYPSTFDIVVEQDADGTYLVKEVMGVDVYSLNQGYFQLAVAEDGNSASIDVAAYYGCLFLGGSNPNYIIMTDAEGGANPVNVTLNADETLTMDDFAVYSFNWSDYSSAELAAYSNVVLTKKTDDTAIDNVVAEDNVVKGIFDMQGRKIDAITAPGLYIVNGKKVLVK